MSYGVKWSPKARDQLMKIELFIAKRIAMKIKYLSENFSFKNVKRIQDTHNFRLRVGDYRVIFEIMGGDLYVLQIGHRKNVYKKGF